MNKLIEDKNFAQMPKTTKTLYTGEVVPCYHEAWREECEARGLLKMPLAERRLYLDRVENNSPARAASLKKVMTAIFELQKNKKRIRY